MLGVPFKNTAAEILGNIRFGLDLGVESTRGHSEEGPAMHPRSPLHAQLRPCPVCLGQLRGYKEN